MVKRESTIVRWSFPISLVINIRIFLQRFKAIVFVAGKQYLQIHYFELLRIVFMCFA